MDAFRAAVMRERPTVRECMKDTPRPEVRRRARARMRRDLRREVFEADSQLQIAVDAELLQMDYEARRAE